MLQDANEIKDSSAGVAPRPSRARVRVEHGIGVRRADEPVQK
jgi:hypothetical protein